MASDLLERVSDRVYRIRDRFVNLYVIEGGKLALVDTGTKGAESRIRLGLRELGKEPADIEYVLLTHHHLDHMGTAAVWKRESRAEVAVHAIDAPVVAGLEKRRGRGVGLRAKVGIALTGLFLPLMRPAFVPPDRRLAGTETLDVLGMPVKVLHAPGHTLGSVAFLLPAEDVLFAGDAVNGRAGTPEPPWFVEDEAASRESFRRLVALQAGTLCPGHGDPIRRPPQGPPESR